MHDEYKGTNPDSSIPRLSVNHSLQPYVHETNEVAMFDPFRMIDSRQKDVPNSDPTKTRTLNTSRKKVRSPEKILIYLSLYYTLL